jgi:hypothetical protein
MSSKTMRWEDECYNSSSSNNDTMRTAVEVEMPQQQQATAREPEE